jgi:ketosteroid isomerase-like protein
MTSTSVTSPSTQSGRSVPSGPVDVVAGVYGAFGRGDMPGLFALLHPEIDWSVDVTAPGGDLVPMLRHGIGHPAVEHYFGGVAQLEFHMFEVGRCFVDGDAVVAEVHLEATHRTTGKRAVLDELHHWIVRDGLAVRYRPYVDTAALIELYRP